MAAKMILVVEDDADIQELLRYTLTREGYQIVQVKNGSQVMPSLEKFKVDAILMDIMLPGQDGMTLCRKIKSGDNYAHIPIIMLTAKSEESDIVSGLEVGADDYVTKPFSPKVLVARLRTLLRRQDEPETSEDNLIHLGEITINKPKHEVLVSGKPVDLTLTEFEILVLLASKPGWVFARAQIVDSVHGNNYAVSDRAIDVQIVGLRKKLGDAGDMILTVRGIGYKIQAN